MSSITGRAPLRSARSLFAMSAFVIAASACTAETYPTTTTLSPTATPPVQLDGQVMAHSTLNLLRAPEPRTATPRPTQTVMGYGSYICSPAGFGQPSRCYAN